MPDFKPKRPRRWLRRLLGVAVLAVLAFIVAAILAVQHLDWIAKWSIHRLFPGVKADLGSLRLVSPTRLEVGELSLKASKTGEPLLDLAGGTIVFSFNNIWRLRLEEVHLQKPNLVISPDLGDALGVQPSKTNGRHANPPGWGIGHILVSDGHLRITRFGEQSPTVNMEFSADFKNFGAGGNTGKIEHAATLKKITVTSQNNQKLLRVGDADIRFTVAGLAQRRIEEIFFENPIINFTADALQSLTPPTARATAPSPSASPSGWSIARARCNYGTLRLRGLKGVDVATRFSFDLHNLGTLGDADQELVVWDVQASSGHEKAFLSLDVAEVHFSVAGLLDRQRVDSVKIAGGRLLVGDAFQKLLATDSSSLPASAAVAAPGWSIGALDISGVRVRLQDKRPGVPDVHMTLNTSLRNVAASGVSSQLFDEVQTVELANIDLNSPLNRTAKIFTLRSVVIRFTLRDLARKHLREAIIRGPIIYLSQDLFIYMERAGAPADKAKSNAAAPTGPKWSVDHLEVKLGKLVIGSGGKKDVGLPLEFETTLDHVALDNLAALKVQAALRVPKQSYDFPAYQIAVEDVEGDLRFAYPPEKGEKNLVQKLGIRKIRWRQYLSGKAWIAVTFDAHGINGQFGGEAYAGYVNGGFSFSFSDDSTWQGWVSGTDVDTKALTDVIAPQNFSLTGAGNFEVQLDAFRKDIRRMRGIFNIHQPGHLKIGKLDAMLADIPAEWAAIKQSTTRIALETLRDFDYTNAKGDFWFVQSQGILGLDLTGPFGSRIFEIALHDNQETQNQWQQGTLGKH